MRCDEARAALIDARYGAGSAELESHLAGCAHCRALRARHDALDRVLALDAPAAPAEDFDARFFARLEQAKRAPALVAPSPSAGSTRRRRTRRLLLLAPPILAAAAALVLLLRPRVDPPAAPPADDLGLAMDLELLEDMEVVQRLDELEAYEVLGQLDEHELEKLAGAEP